MSDHTASTMSVPLEGVLDHLRACSTRATVTASVPVLTRTRTYTGAHHITRRRSGLRALLMRAARRISHEWRKPRTWITGPTTALFTAVGERMTVPQLEKTLDVMERAMDILEAGPIRRAYSHARARRTAAQTLRAKQHQKEHDTEQWWAKRSGDYPILIPTQPLKIIEVDQ